MQELKFWRVNEADREASARLQRSFDKLYHFKPKGYHFELSDEKTSLIPDKEKVVYVASSERGKLLGYAICSEKPPNPSIGAISMLDALSSNGDLTDFNGKPVSRTSLAQYNGYADYTGLGAVLYISRLDVFRHNMGIGSRFLEFIKGQGHELIELEANGIGPSRFFQKNGFVDTGIDAENGEQLVMVWNNPSHLQYQMAKANGNGLFSAKPS
ncbi:MAG TPA: hypothetical protein VLD37_03740 [Candidatus Bilamarchaeum sp.]|nr:hypothetical protein [Candidatus Bilamarchaeum sp.]